MFISLLYYYYFIFVYMYTKLWQYCICNKVRSEEGSRQGWLVETRVIYWFSNTKLNSCALCARMHINSHGCLGFHSLCSFWLPLSDQPMRPSLHSVSLSVLPFSGGFYPSLHANYCNQTQVFLILHLTHLLTAAS